MARCLTLLCFCLVGWTNVAVFAQTVNRHSIKLETKKLDGVSCFVLTGLERPSSAVVKFWVAAAESNAPPLAGQARVEGKRIVFRPRFPLLAGSYRAEVRQDNNALPIKLRTKVDASETKQTTMVESVFPSAAEIPENTLKFYVHFSAPMRKGDIYKYVRLREVDGKDIELPFLEIEQEFWSRDSKRLTLLLDPGRIKRGLKPRKEMGPIFEAGKSYELVVSGNWPDSKGVKFNCGVDFVKRFKVGEDDHQQPAISNWTIVAPKAGSKGPLEVVFPEPLDRAMLERCIKVFRTNSADRVEGAISVAKEETVWKLTPKNNWTAGDYWLEVDSTLEDLCGNSIGRQFDVDVFEKTEGTQVGTKSVLRFPVDSQNK